MTCAASGSNSLAGPSGSNGSCSSSSSSGGGYMLPARKRPRRLKSVLYLECLLIRASKLIKKNFRTCSTSADNSPNSASHYLQYELPDEVLLTILSYLLEQDLCHLAQVCKRFQVIANDTELW